MTLKTPVDNFLIFLFLCNNVVILFLFVIKFFLKNIILPNSGLLGVSIYIDIIRSLYICRQIPAEVITRSMRKQDSMDNGSDVFGNTSEVNVKNTANDSRHVIEYPIRSPLSIGKMKTAEFRKSSIVTGVKMVKTKYEYRLSSSMEYLSSAYTSR